MCKFDARLLNFCLGASLFILVFSGCSGGPDLPVSSTGLETGDDSTGPSSPLFFSSTPGASEVSLRLVLADDPNISGVMIRRALGSFPQNQNDSLLFSNILDQAAVTRISIAGEFTTNSTTEVDLPDNFILNTCCEVENVTFQSFSQRIDFERERVFQLIKAYFSKIRLIFANLSLVKSILFIIVSATIFNQQFGGNRDLPVISN